MATHRRWDTDDRGRGVRDAAVAKPHLEALDAALTLPGWVAEDPEVHLQPHIVEAAAGAGIGIVGMEVLEGILEIRVERGDRNARAWREVAFVLAGSFAEASTHVRQTPDGEFEIVTGMLEGDGQFAPHGHLVRIRALES